MNFSSASEGENKEVTLGSLKALQWSLIGGLLAAKASGMYQPNLEKMMYGIRRWYNIIHLCSEYLTQCRLIPFEDWGSVLPESTENYRERKILSLLRHNMSPTGSRSCKLFREHYVIGNTTLNGWLRINSPQKVIFDLAAKASFSRNGMRYKNRYFQTFNRYFGWSILL